MKTSTFYKRLENASILTKAGVIKNGYDNDLETIRLEFTPSRHNPKIGSSVRLYLKKWSRSSGRNQLQDRGYYRTIEILKALGLSYETGNDSPRGGVEGDFIELKKSEYNKIKDCM